MVPETAWQRAVVMAIERGKFQNLLFDDFDRLDHAALRAVTRIVVDFQSLAAQRGVTLVGEPSAHTLMVAADPDRLQQILNNLVGNALRHTPADGRVEIGAASHNDDGEAVRFSILNTGETIPGADLPYVFERFYRSDTSRSSNTGDF